jgi:hypothetical protein
VVQPPPPPDPLNDDEWDVQVGWNDSRHPERVLWTKMVFDLVGRQESLLKASDWMRLCPNYWSLTKEKRQWAATELISSIAYYESGWDPTNWMKEAFNDPDPITKRQVRSEGLLQLSYQDKLTYPGLCDGFNWLSDKGLPDKDPDKTIMDPFLNLDCGIKILNRQVAKHGTIFYDQSYWSTLRPSGKYGKTVQIAALVRKLPFCGG